MNAILIAAHSAVRAVGDRAGLSALLILLTGFLACSGEGSAGRDFEPEVLARAGDTQITMSDVRESVGPQLEQLENQYRQQRYELVEGALEQLLNDRLLEEAAADRDTTVDGLIEVEAGETFTVTDEQVASWFAQNQARLRGRSLEELAPQIEDFLIGQRRQQVVTEVLERQRADREIVYFLEPFRFALRNQGAPATGPADAPVTLVEFSDFECPYCSRFFPTLKRIQAAYGDHLQIVYRQFPLTNLHPNAFKAAEASLCAQEQDRFWQMHDLLFQEQQALGVEALKEKAGRLGLDQGAFDECLDSGRHAERIEADLQEGQSVGVNGTPALFVNGTPVPGGAVPFEDVAAAIERELRLQGIDFEADSGPYRVEVDDPKAPALGPADAPVTLVEFSDFECPYCSRFFPTLKRLEEEFGEQLRIVYRQFPIPSLHPNAYKAAEASLCAHEQDRFWEMHDLLFQEQDALGEEALREKAGRLGLDQAVFDECLDSGRHEDRIQQDLSAGRSAGITGTPALFVNGIEVPGGAVPFETVAQVIESELQGKDD
jgi:protein-disulfide isomerase